MPRKDDDLAVLSLHVRLAAVPSPPVMHSSARRRFVLGLAGLVPLPFVARRVHGLAVADLDPALLRALAAAILPAELGEDGLARAVSGFERWLAGYREGAELLHGYGTGQLHRAGPSPALRWAGQLRDLDAAARTRGGKSFAALDVTGRREVVQAALSGAQPSRLPSPDRARHLAVGLLAHFYDSAAAADLCYGARIGRNSCRPLAESVAQPGPLAGRS
jgi:hypothetical protein